MIQKQKLSDSERRRDAHEKIRLGGLIVKAELQDNDNLSKDTEKKLSLLAGLLEEAAEGGLADPHNVISWEARGEQLLKAKCMR